MSAAPLDTVRSIIDELCGTLETTEEIEALFAGIRALGDGSSSATALAATGGRVAEGLGSRLLHLLALLQDACEHLERATTESQP